MALMVIMVARVKARVARVVVTVCGAGGSDGMQW